MYMWQTSGWLVRKAKFLWKQVDIGMVGSRLMDRRCCRNGANKWQRTTIIVMCLFLATTIYYFKDVINRGRIAYGIIHILDETNCENAGYRNFRYEVTSPPDLIAWNSTHDQTIKKDPHYAVPNIVHYIWYTEEPKKFKFHHMLSVKSAIKFIKPDVIFIHLNILPTGEYWDMVSNLPEVKVILREPTQCLSGNQLRTAIYETSGSNVDRLVVLAEMGGIYLDLDTIVVRSFDTLRQYPCTLGIENEAQAKFCGAVIVCSKESTFLNMWINSYVDDYRIFTWAYNSGRFPFKLWQRFPHLLHVEPTKLVRPNGDEYKQIWGDETYPWWENYCIHIWYRKWKDPLIRGKEPTFENIKTWNSTFGAMARNVLLDNYELVGK